MIGKHDSAIKVRRILVAVDGSQHSERALDYGIYMAKGLEAELLIVNAVDWGEISRDIRASSVSDAERQTEELAAKSRKEASAWLEGFVERAKAAGVASVSSKVLVEPGKSHVRAVVENADVAADLIVVGTRGHGKLKRLLVGSFANGLISEASRPVLVVK